MFNEKKKMEESSNKLYFKKVFKDVLPNQFNIVNCNVYLPKYKCVHVVKCYKGRERERKMLNLLTFKSGIVHPAELF